MTTTRRAFIQGAVAARRRPPPCLPPRSGRPTRPSPAPFRRPARRSRRSASGPGSPSMSATIPLLRHECTDVMARLLRGRRPDDRFLADVRFVAAGHRPRAGAARAADGAVFGGQGVDVVGCGRSRADRAVARLLGRAALRPRPGPQSRRLGGASADAVRDEGGGPPALCRHHHLRGPPARSVRADHAQPAARLRAAHLQRRRPRCRGPAAAARRRPRHGGDRQPAVPPGRADAAARRRAAAGLGRRDRGNELGAVHPEVHRLPSGRHRRHSRHDPRRSCPREHGRRVRPLPDAAMRERMQAHVRDV